jgi:hypothetical protein
LFNTVLQHKITMDKVFKILKYDFTFS